MRVQMGGGERQQSYTFVTFVRRAACGFRALILLEGTGLLYQSDQRLGEKPHSPLSHCLCGNMEKGHFFGSKKTSTFVNDGAHVGRSHRISSGYVDVRKRPAIPLGIENRV